MTGPLVPHPAVATLTIDELDALIALTHADITWHSPTYTQRAWAAIDQLLDRRNQLTNSCSSHNNSSIQEAKS